MPSVTWQRVLRNWWNFSIVSKPAASLAKIVTVMQKTGASLAVF
jgi:hypothetical protein